MGEKLKKNSISSYSFKKQKGNCTTFLIQHHTKKKLQQKRLWRFSIFQEFKTARLQNQQRWPLHWMSFYDDLSNASCSTARKNELLSPLSSEEHDKKIRVIESFRRVFLFYRRVEKYLELVLPGARSPANHFPHAPVRRITLGNACQKTSFVTLIIL